MTETFVEQIAQAKDMIRRLEAHVGLTDSQREALPAEQRVAYKETDAWGQAVVDRIRATFGKDALSRLRTIGDLLRDEVNQGKGDEVGRVLNYLRRVTALLVELQERLGSRTSGKSPGASSIVSILFLAADPTDESHLRLGEEFRNIQEKLKLARLRDSFRLELPQLSARTEDVSQTLLDTQPEIVHFSGHGTSEGALCFETQSGRAHPVPPEALAALFEQFSNRVKCVVLNACYSQAQAQAIARHIEYVVGMKEEIGDKAAIAFAIGFYQALGAGRSIVDAYKLGCAQVGLQDIAESLTPVLVRRDR